jgi:hypothetical protein
MKSIVFVILLLSYTGSQLLAQHPLVGTWEMVSVKGIGADGESFFFDTSSVRETKVITPTHYMLIAWDVDEDTLVFNRTMAGQVRLEGDKYIEIPTHASVPIFENVKVDFKWKLDGDTFTQSGTIVRPDGKSIVLEALIFRRVTGVSPHTQNPAIGTWALQSATYRTGAGKSSSTFNESDSRLLVVTPTHWMRMDHKNKTFAGSMLGTYVYDSDTILTTPEFSSPSSEKAGRMKLTQKVKGNELHLTFTGTTPGGESGTFYDVYKKIK